MFYKFDVLGEVISILQHRQQDLDAVTLEEAKSLTLAVILEHREESSRHDGQAWSGAEQMLA